MAMKNSTAIKLGTTLLGGLLVCAQSGYAGEQVFYQSVGNSGEAVFSDEAIDGAQPYVVLFDTPSNQAVDTARVTTREQLSIAQTLQQSRRERESVRDEIRDQRRVAEQAAIAAQPTFLEPEPRYRPYYPYYDRVYYGNNSNRYRNDRRRNNPERSPEPEEPAERYSKKFQR